MDNYATHLLELIAQHQIRYGWEDSHFILQVETERQALSFNYENAVKVFVSPQLRPGYETKLLEIAVEFEAHGRPFTLPSIPIKLVSDESQDLTPEEFVAALSGEIYRLSQLFTVVMNKPAITQQYINDLMNDEVSLGALFSEEKSGEHCLHIGVINSELRDFVKAKIDTFRTFPDLYITDSGIKYVLHPKSKDEDEDFDIQDGFLVVSYDDDDEIIEDRVIVIDMNKLGLISSRSAAPR